MSYKYTRKKDIQTQLECLNAMSGKNGLIVEYSNGLCNLYLINKKTYKKDHTILKHIISGTKSFIWDYIHAMNIAFWDLK